MSIVPKLRKEFDLIEENLKYYSGDTFEIGWIGPLVPKTHPHHDEVMEQIERVFQSRNIIAECIERHVHGLVGKKPHWYFTDSTGDRVDNESASVAELLMQRWIDRQYRLAISGENALTNATLDATKNMLVTGVGYLRLWSPARFKNSQNLITRIALHSPNPNSVVFKRDSDGFTETIFYYYSVDNIARVEVQRIDSSSNLTVFSTLNEQGLEIEEETFTLDLGGRFSIFEMRSPSLITSSVKSAQNAINFALTMLIRSAEVGGFRERLILGAQPPGRWDDNDKFIPDPEFSIGPGQTSFIQGVPLLDEMGNLKGYTSPSVNYAEPVSPQTFIENTQAFAAIIYHQFSQTHLLGSDLQLSGVSREQARQDFETKLAEHADIVSAAIAGIYGSALMMMVQDEGDIDQYRDLDVAVQLRLNATKPLPQEQEQLLKFQQAGLLSKATAMSLSGFVEDSDSELSLLADEERSRTAIDDASSLLTVGAIDQPQAVELLRRRGRLEADTVNGNGNGTRDEVLNGQG